MLWIELIKQFTVNHWLDILFVVLFIAGLMTMWVRGYKKEVRSVILDLVAKAEAELGSGTGRIKYIRVTRWIYARVPWIVKAFISDEELDDLIEAAVTELKNYVRGNKTALLSQNEEAVLRRK